MENGVVEGQEPGGKPGQGLPGEPGSVPGQESRLPSPLSCLCHFRGAWRQSPYLLYSHPAMSASWLALATGSSLASTQTQASARPSGRLSLATQGPPGPGSRSGQSPPSPSQMASLLIALRPPLAPDPCRPQLGQDLVWGMMEKPSFRPSHDPAIPLLGIHTEKTRRERDTSTPMSIAALFIIARTWKQPRCPSADEWIRKLWAPHERLPEILVVPREKTPTGAAARGNP